MDKNLQNIEDLFRKGLTGKEEMPPPEVWEAIDKKLGNDNIVRIKYKYNQLKKATIFLAILLSGFIVYFLFYKYNHHHELAKQNRADTIQNSIGKNKNNSEAQENKTTTLNKPIDSLNLIPGNQNSITGIENKIITKDILKTETSNNLPAKKDIGSGKNTAPVIPNDVSNSSNEKEDKFTGSNPHHTETIKTPGRNVNEQVVAANVSRYETGKKLPLKQLYAMPITGIVYTANWVNSKSIIEPLVDIIRVRGSNDHNSKITSPTAFQSSRFSITGFFSPDIPFNQLHDDKSGNNRYNADSIEKNENQSFSSTLGVLIDYKVSPHWSLQSGLTLSTTHFDIDPETIYAQRDNTGNVKFRLNTSSGYGYISPSFNPNPRVGDSLHTTYSSHTLQYLGLPVAVKYNVDKGKFTINAMAGISINFLTNGAIRTLLRKGNEDETEHTNHIHGLKPIYFSVLTGLGVDYKLNKKFALTFNPSLRLALNSINKDVPVHSFPKSFGLSFGLKMEL
ncbi:MAG: outer membrane beta-barrel protein [Bacteroidota bacterium]|nr:outer membrane beta-barrel protein [Bacteroidota bacterium]